MNWFPQLSSGASVQFPVRKILRWRSLTNALESGERISIEDTGASVTEWQLTYRDLSDSEVNAIQALYSVSRGRWDSFGFIDPLANLLAGSEDLTRPEWQIGGLQAVDGSTDPNGRNAAWTVTNGTASDLTLQQTTGVPGSATACFSLYIRSERVGMIGMRRDLKTETVPVGPVWRRVVLSGSGDGALVQSTFGVVFAAGQVADVWGLQVEAQPFASAYKATSTPQGIYERTQFASDELRFQSTGPGCTACQIDLISRG